MNHTDRQKFEELTVFGEFVRVCPLPLVPETARSGPNPPDVLCDLESGEALAFEMVSAEDVTRDDAHPEPVPWTKKLNDSMELRNALCREYQQAVAAERVSQPERFRFHSVVVFFYDQTTCKIRKTAVPRVIEYLNQHGPGSHMIKDGEVRSIHCEPYPIASPLEGPNFSAHSGCGARPYIVEGIKKKLTKTYESSHKLQLLAWSSTATVSEFDGLRKDSELVEWLQSNGMDPFDRIWVFGYGEKSIVFDSADVVARTIRRARLIPRDTKGSRNVDSYRND